MERRYCHGGMRQGEKGPRDGCAVLWPVWGMIPRLIEDAELIREMRMPPPSHLTRDEWRAMYRIRNKLRELGIESAKQEGEDE